MALHPQVKQFLEQLKAANAPAFHELEPVQAREAYQQLVSMVPPPEATIGGTRDLELDGAEGSIKGRLYWPESPESAMPVLVYFHGGGFVIGDLETHDPLCRGLCAASGCAVLAVDYRLAPEHPFPAAPDDCMAATLWIARKAQSLGLDASRMAVGGDSAGGNLAAIVAQRIRDEGGPALRAQLLYYPATRVAEEPTQSMIDNAEGYLLTREDMTWFFGHYLPDPAKADLERLAPLQAERHDGLPPTRVVVAGFDPLRDEGKAYADALQAAGSPVTFVEHADTIHGFMNFAGLFEGAARELRDSGQWLRERLLD